jgi:hypothetical protein
MPVEQVPAPACAARRDLLADPGPGAGRGREAVAEPEVMARGVRAAADHEPCGEGREGD